MVQIGGNLAAILANRKSTSDFMQADEELAAKKRAQAIAEQTAQLQLKKAEKDMTAFNPDDIKNLAAKSIYEAAQGLPVTPAGRAAIEAMATLEGNKTEYKPDEEGNLRAITAPNPYSQYLGGGMMTPVLSGGESLDPMEASRAAIAQRNAEMGSANPYGQNDEVVPLPMNIVDVENALGGQSMPTQTLGIPENYTGDKNDLLRLPANQGVVMDNTKRLNLPTVSAPNSEMLLQVAPGAGQKTEQFAREQAIKGAADMAAKNYESQIKAAEEEFKSGVANNKVTQVLTRMRQINDSLKDMGAIVSQEMPYAERLKTAASTTQIGQGIRKFDNPEAQALAEEYSNLQSTLLPYYATAAGLGSKSLDSEGERKSILSSFGSPAGIYEANKNQINNLYSLFGVTDGQSTGIKFLGFEE
jgi:hypothetical protein